MSFEDNDIALSWDDEIESDGSDFTLLDEGDYDFVVKKFERGRFDGSDKMSACPKAILTLQVGDGENQTTVIENLFLNRKAEWKISSFFRSIGLKKHGEKLRMDWNKVVGASGRCRVFVDEFESNKTGKVLKNNKIDKFYDKEDKPKAPPRQQAMDPRVADTDEAW